MYKTPQAFERHRMNPFPLPKVGDRIILPQVLDYEIATVYSVDEKAKTLTKLPKDGLSWSWDYELDDAIPYTKLTCYLQGIEYEENP
jgi:hypothetical protein